MPSIYPGFGSIGVYVDIKSATKTLAVVFVSSACPEVYTSGIFGHYLDSTHILYST